MVNGMKVLMKKLELIIGENNNSKIKWDIDDYIDYFNTVINEK